MITWQSARPGDIVSVNLFTGAMGIGCTFPAAGGRGVVATSLLSRLAVGSTSMAILPAARQELVAGDLPFSFVVARGGVSLTVEVR